MMLKALREFFDLPPARPRAVNSPHFGYKFYSSYFSRYCVVTRYESDTEWWFILEATDCVLKARSPFSLVKRIVEGIE